MASLSPHFNFYLFIGLCLKRSFVSRRFSQMSNGANVGAPPTLEGNDDFIWSLPGTPTTALNFAASFFILTFVAYELLKARNTRF
jgi:hypothetical protein